MQIWWFKMLQKEDWKGYNFSVDYYFHFILFSVGFYFSSYVIFTFLCVTERRDEFHEGMRASLYWGWFRCKVSLFFHCYLDRIEVSFSSLLLFSFTFLWCVAIQVNLIASRLLHHCKCPWWPMVMNNHSFVNLACPFIHSVDREWGRSYTPCLIAFNG